MEGLKTCGLELLNELKLEKLVPLSKFTTLRVGGAAQWLAEPRNEKELKLLISWAHTNQMPCQIIGAGSNLLINDSGLKGISICMKKLQGNRVDKKSGVIEALCGESIPSLSRQAAKAGLHGLEWAVGIPGTVGGAAVMNAGAQGGCIANCLESLKVMPFQGGKTFEINNKDLEFSYRNSLLQKEKLIVLSARFQLQPGHNHQKLSQLTNQNLTHRTSSQPYHLPSCGSVFRNPEPLKAGRVIEELGLKGHRIGGAEISKMHANFIVNLGNATANDVSQLIKFVQQQVLNTHGFLLQPEVKQLGFSSKT